MKYLLLVFSLLFCTLAAAQDDIYVVVIKKAVEKKQSRWSLGEWMTTKRKIEEMDRWLALNSDWPASIFEGYIDGSFAPQMKLMFNELDDQKTNVFGARAGLFLAFIGVEGTYDQSDLEFKHLEGQISLRIFGNYEQNNNFTLGFGRRHSDYQVEEGGFNDKYRNDFASARLNLMLATFFGIKGEYKKFFSSTSLRQSEKTSGEAIEATAYFDILFLNIYASYFKENWKVGSERPVREGMRYGLRLYF